VDHHNCLECMLRVGTQSRFYFRGISSSTPGAWHYSTLIAKFLRELAPELREVAGLEHQYTIAGRKRVYYGGFPRRPYRKRDT